MPVDREAEERIVKAACLLVRAEVLDLIEADDSLRNSFRLAKYLDVHVRPTVVAAINTAANDLRDRVLDEIDTWEPEAPPQLTGRMSQIRNDQPCTACGRVTRAAVHVLKQGSLVGVECDQCAPEFGGT